VGHKRLPKDAFAHTLPSRSLAKTRVEQDESPGQNLIVKQRPDRTCGAGERSKGGAPAEGFYLAGRDTLGVF
jgi:hypothetical protein